ncbi:Hok/Gef family protein [Nissabacter archeti]|uniref:Hok/Gef family protein n=1 Tax=Nissabacter archeti TaxID=1917880 RepID=UPI0030B81E13
MLSNIRLASYPPQGKELEASMLQKSGVICVIVICITLLIFMWITRSSLCEVRIRNNNIDVAVILDYES